MFTLWLIIVIFAVLLDLITTAFIGISFTISGLITMVADKLGMNSTAQVVLFLGLSVFFFLTLFPYMRKKMKVAKYVTTEETYIGKVIKIEEDLTEVKTTKIKIDGIYWTVELLDNVTKGDKIEIIEMKGNKFIAKKYVEKPSDTNEKVE